MQNAWAATIDHLTGAMNLPAWSGVAAFVLFLIVLLWVAAKAEKTVANAALAVMALLAAVSAGVLPHLGEGVVSPAHSPRAAIPSGAGQAALASASGPAALACLDGLAGDVVEAGCERAVFAGPDIVAAAVSHTARQLSLLNQQAISGAGDLDALRRVLARDRFGFVAHVLTRRDGCTPDACPAFQLLADPAQIIANMNARTYDLLVARAAPGWPGAAGLAAAPNAGGVQPAPAGPPASGRPVGIEFPTADSIPPVSIMTPEPAPGSPAAAPGPASGPTARSVPPPKAKAAKARAGAPVSIAPPASDDGE